MDIINDNDVVHYTNYSNHRKIQIYNICTNIRELWILLKLNDADIDGDELYSHFMESLRFEFFSSTNKHILGQDIKLYNSIVGNNYYIIDNIMHIPAFLNFRCYALCKHVSKYTTRTTHIFTKLSTKKDVNYCIKYIQNFVDVPKNIVYCGIDYYVERRFYNSNLIVNTELINHLSIRNLQFLLFHVEMKDDNSIDDISIDIININKKIIINYSVNDINNRLQRICIDNKIYYMAIINNKKCCINHDNFKYFLCGNIDELRIANFMNGIKAIKQICRCKCNITININNPHFVHRIYMYGFTYLPY